MCVHVEKGKVLFMDIFSKLENIINNACVLLKRFVITNLRKEMCIINLNETKDYMSLTFNQEQIKQNKPSRYLLFKKKSKDLFHVLFHIAT